MKPSTRKHRAEREAKKRRARELWRHRTDYESMLSTVAAGMDVESVRNEDGTYTHTFTGKSEPKTEEEE